jgi:hypothetical protein
VNDEQLRQIVRDELARYDNQKLKAEAAIIVMLVLGFFIYWLVTK